MRFDERVKILTGVERYPVGVRLPRGEFARYGFVRREQSGCIVVLPYACRLGERGARPGQRRSVTREHRFQQEEHED
jgi:hypothetical protein